jgi:hypothetical protein
MLRRDMACRAQLGLVDDRVERDGNERGSHGLQHGSWVTFCPTELVGTSESRAVRFPDMGTSRGGAMSESCTVPKRKPLNFQWVVGVWKGMQNPISLP